MKEETKCDRVVFVSSRSDDVYFRYISHLYYATSIKSQIRERWIHNLRNTLLVSLGCSLKILSDDKKISRRTIKLLSSAYHSKALKEQNLFNPFMSLKTKFCSIKN